MSERKLYNKVEPIIRSSYKSFHAILFYHIIYAIQNMFVLELSCYGIMSVNVDI
jgi:hypothetical protein